MSWYENISDDRYLRLVERKFVDDLNRIMLRHKISQLEVARRIKCNNSTIHTILTTRRVNSVEMLYKIARAVGVDIYEPPPEMLALLRENEELRLKVKKLEARYAKAGK